MCVRFWRGTGWSYAKAYLAYALAAAGRRSEGLALTHEMLQLAELRYVLALDFSIAAIGLGEYNKALDWLHQAYQEGSNYLIYICHDALFDPLRAESRFQNLVQRLGLAGAQAQILDV
jgi:hypothetical protein